MLEVKYRMKESTIDTFRDFVNENIDFMIQFYVKENEKNLWNCVCACMDWIDVSLEYIDNIKYDSNINVKTMQVYSYISSIDIIFESIKQLHRVIIDSKSIPFKDDCTIFKGKLHLDDNNYFKHIRAVFGAHPVAININGLRYFATWPNDSIYTEYDFATILYTNDKNGDDVVIGFKFEELEEFLRIRYGYLNTLIDKINSSKQEYFILKSNVPIEIVDDKLKQLEILKSELEMRTESSYYKEIIDNLIILYSAIITEESNTDIINQYTSKTDALIEELTVNIQDMNFKELENSNILYQSFPSKIRYELSKLYDCIHLNKYDFMFNMHIEVISDYLKDYIVINDNMDYYELYLVLNAGLFAYNNSK